MHKISVDKRLCMRIQYVVYLETYRMNGQTHTYHETRLDSVLLKGSRAECESQYLDQMSFLMGVYKWRCGITLCTVAGTLCQSPCGCDLCLSETDTR